MSIQSSVNTIIGAYTSPKIIKKIGKQITEETEVEKASNALKSVEKYTKSQEVPKDKNYATALNEFVDYQMSKVAEYGLKQGNFNAFKQAYDFLNEKSAITKSQKTALKKRRQQLGGK